jgi:glycosyltransferase involved in cell wall biosynthesis
MTDAPLVSVIVPNHNYGRVLAHCLRSVQRQTYTPLEIVFVDDCSTDDSVQIAASLGIPAISPPANVGVCGARNLGAAHARGEILFFLDSDIALEDDAVAKAVAILQADPRIGAVHGNFDFVPLVRDSLVKDYRNLFRRYYFLLHEGRITTFLPTAMLAMPRVAWDYAGPFAVHLTQSEGADLGERVNGRYECRLTDGFRGRHDDDQTLGIMLRKVFVRTYVQIPFFLQPRYAAGTAGSRPARAMAAATLTVATLPLVLWQPWLAVLPVGLLAVYLAIDRRMYRYVFANRSIPFGLYFVAIHFLVNLTYAVGVAAGIAQWLTSRSFRRLYQRASA